MLMKTVVQLPSVVAIFWFLTLSATKASDPPVYISQPQSVMVAAGDTLRLSCLATGSSPISYIWQKDATFLPTQTNAALVITNTQLEDSGQYTAVASNAYGVERSRTADVVVYTGHVC